MFCMGGLGDRIRRAADEIGGLTALADSTDIVRRTIGRYVSETTEPTFSTLISISRATGVRLEWLATGEGEMFADAGKAPPPVRAIDPALFRQVGRLVAKVHQEEGVRLPPDAVLDEQADAYNALITRAEDPADPAELEALLPWLEARLRKRLQTAAAAPGTGKRPAS